MKTNVGTIDMVIRLLLGIVLMVLAAIGTIGWWGWIGVVPFATGLFKFCPAYALFHFSTCPAKPPAGGDTAHGQPT